MTLAYSLGHFLNSYSLIISLIVTLYFKQLKAPASTVSPKSRKGTKNWSLILSVELLLICSKTGFNGTLM